MKSLILLGGAVKNAFSVGVLKHLLGDLKIQYNILEGISAGSLNIIHIAHFKHGQEEKCISSLLDLWYGLTTKSIYKKWGPLGLLHGIWRPSIYDRSPLAKLIKNIVNVEKLREAGKILRIGAVSLTTGEYKDFDENYHDLVGACLASATVPGIFEPIMLDEQLWVDGGLKNASPVKAAIFSGATEIDIIMTSPKKNSKIFSTVPNILDIITRVLDIAFDEIVCHDINKAIRINDIIKNGINIPGKKYIPINVMRPDIELTSSSLNFEPGLIRRLIDIGYDTAVKNYPKF